MTDLSKTDLSTVVARQRRATDEAFVIRADGRIHDLVRVNALPTRRELADVLGDEWEAIPVGGRSGLVLLRSLVVGGVRNRRAEALIDGTVRGDVVVLARRLIMRQRRAR